MPPSTCAFVSHGSMARVKCGAEDALRAVTGSLWRRDTYGVGDHGGEDRALAIVAVVLAGDE